MAQPAIGWRISVSESWLICLNGVSLACIDSKISHRNINLSARRLAAGGYPILAYQLSRRINQLKISDGGGMTEMKWLSAKYRQHRRA
jgi:hypothetical protein